MAIAMRTYQCEACGKTNTKPKKHRSRFCNKSCAAKGPRPNARKGKERVCKHCGNAFYVSPSRSDIYCSYLCSKLAGTPRKAGLTGARNGRSKKDNNHDAIVKCLEKMGCQIIDLSHVGGGFPDLLVSCRKELLLVEVKNPETSYGTRGLNPLQTEFAESWKGGPVYVVRTTDDCVSLVQGDREPLQYSSQSTYVPTGK